jgi:hypothetical protein
MSLQLINTGFMRKSVILPGLLLIIFLAPVFGQKEKPSDEPVIKEDTLRKNFGIFSSDDLLEISIRFNLSAYQRKNLNGGSLNGVLTFKPGKPDSLSKNIVIKTRGAFRYDKCSFAPMEINFRKSLYAYPDSGKIKKLKLVTHCQSGIKYDDFVLKEYLVYKLFNVLTDSGFKVRLLSVKYIDTEKKRKPLIQYGIFIEPKSLLASRNHAVVVDAMNLTQNHIQPEVMDRVAIFNYMVANWDWAVQSLHNIVVLKSLSYTASGLGVAVPFDFDLTGIVDPDYNLPPPEKGLTSNRDRLYMGVCRDEATYRKALEEFIKKKDRFYKVINDFPYLNDRSKKDLTNYLDSFFNQLDKEKDIHNLIGVFLNQCIKI